MKIFYKILFILTLFSTSAFAYSHPKGLYTLEYPVSMPNVSLTDQNNNTLDILNTSANLTIFVFWSQSCYPCLKEMKNLEKLYKKAKKDNIDIKLVSPSSEWNNLNEERAFLSKYGAPTIPFYNDTNNALSLKLGIGSTPYTVIMDRFGKKVATIQGYTNWEAKKLYKQILSLIR